MHLAGMHLIAAPLCVSYDRFMSMLESREQEAVDFGPKQAS